MRIAFVGCGYAADLYALTLKNHPELELAGVFDRNAERAVRFANNYSVYQYSSFEDLLADHTIALVVNLTNPKEHYRVTKACLKAGKHVYSEKPLALSFLEAQELVALSNSSTVLAVAPATLLGEAAQTVWQLLQEGAIGQIKLVYAELDDGAIHQMNYSGWISNSGVPWPFKDEFETGCTFEHAAYHLSWLTAFFGPARRVTSFSSCLIPDKLDSDTMLAPGDDFSLACIEFASGVVARLTCSTIAPKNHSLTIIGTTGIITVEDCWRFESPVYIQHVLKPSEQKADNVYLSGKQCVPLRASARLRVKYDDAHDIDFARGIADVAEALAHHRQPRLSAEHALHILEITQRIIHSENSFQHISTSFTAIAPML